MSITSKDLPMEQRLLKVGELVALFEANKPYYTSKEYTEAEVREEFINPLLECLKWDVRNEKGAKPRYREVIKEDRVIIDGGIKHPDYTLCYGGERKIYIEAKQPSVNLKENPKPALQVRTYACTNKIPIAILTDFEELAIYDTRIKPKDGDSAAVARIEYLTYDKYVENFQSLYNRISWDAVDLGDFDSYWEGTKNKKGTATVDDDILQLIEEWRLSLADDIALHNADMDEFNLTSAVQKIIDRILFLRICEDKEIEENGILKKIADSKKDIYQQLKVLFDAANNKFNAGLFSTNNWLDALTVSDKSLAKIIEAIYPPNCPYDFSVLPVEILGTIYERFLGKIIRFTRKTKNGHRVEIIEKPEVQKAGGVYYTPQYIVNYIVKETIGAKLKDKTPDEVAKMRFVDPACGSGSFLTGAYQYLLNWHLDYYLDPERNPEKLANKSDAPIYKDAKTKEYKLTIEEKRRILLNNIYGVDIDAQAVEVTKLSLFLKLLENEGRSLSKKGQAQLFRASDLQAKILPSLVNNIKCGNSLIGSDYYNDKDLTLFGIEEQRKVNVFDWDKEFPHIFKDGGFDCVIGNPPYVKEYTYRAAFDGLYNHPIYQGKMDLWYFFGYKGIEISKKDALVGFIAPNNWITNTGAGKFRNFVLNNTRLLEFIDFGDYKVFENVGIQTMIYIMKNTKDNASYTVPYSRLNKSKATKSEAAGYVNGGQEKNATRFSCNIERDTMLNNYILFLDDRINNLLDKIAINGKEHLLANELAQGMVLPQDFCLPKAATEILHDESLAGHGIFNLTQAEYDLLNLTNEEKLLVKPFYTSEQLNRYYGSDQNSLWVIYTGSEFKNKKAMLPYPHLKEHLDTFAKIITSDNKPYGLHRARNEKFFKGEKIVSLRKTVFPCFTYTDFDCYVSQSYNIIKTTRWNNKALTAILNSKIISFWLRYKGKMQGDNYQIDKEPLLAIPLPAPEVSQNSDLIRLVESMLVVKKQLSVTSSETDKKFLEQRTKLIDQQINALVYQLYALTPEEIATIEGK